MDRLCRLCTGNVLSMEFVDLFENVDLMEKVEKHLQIKCSQDEFALPHKICNTCIYELEAFVNFFERCHSVQKALKIQSELYSNQTTDRSLFKRKKIETSCRASDNIDGNGAVVSTVPNQTPLLNQLVRYIKSEEPSDTCISNKNLPSSEIVAKVIVANHVKEEKDDEDIFIVDPSDDGSNDFRDDVIDVDDDSDVEVLVEQDASEQTNKSKDAINSSTNKTEGVRNSSEGCNQPPGGEWCQSAFQLKNLLHSSENGNKSLLNSVSRPSNTSACDDSLEVTRRLIGTKQTFVSNTSSESHENVKKDQSSNTSACDDSLEVTRRLIGTKQTFVNNTSSESHENVKKDQSSNSCRKRRRRRRSSSSSPGASDTDGFPEGSRTEIVPSHKCGVCDRAFKRKVQLDLHLKTHSTKKTSDVEEESDVHESSGSEFSCGEENRSTKTSVPSDHAQKQRQKERSPSILSDRISDKISSSLSFDYHRDKVLLPSQRSKHQNRVQQPSATVKRSFQRILPFPVAKPGEVQNELKNSQVSQNSNMPQQPRSTRFESLPKETQPQVLVQFIPVSSSQPNQCQSSPVSQVITTPHQVTSSSPQIQNTPGIVLVGPFPSLPTFQVVQSLFEPQLAQQSQNSRIIADVSSSQHLKSLPVTSSSVSLHDLQKKQSTQVSQVAPPLSSSTLPQISQQSCGTSVVQVIQNTPPLQKQFPASHQLQMILNNCSSSASEQTAQITQVIPQQTACVMPSTSQSHVTQQGNIIALSPQLQTNPVSHTSMKTSQSSVQSSQIVPSTMQSQIIYIGQSSVQSQVTYQSQHPEIVHVLPPSQWTSSSTQSQGSQKSCNSQIFEAVSSVPYSSSTQSQLLLPSTQPKIVVASSHQQLLQVQENNVGQQHQHVQPSHTVSKTTKSQEDQTVVNACTPASLQFQDPKNYPLIPTSQPVQQPLVSCSPVFQQQSQICRSFQQSQIMPIIQSVQGLQPLQIPQPSNSQEYPENHTTSLCQVTHLSQQIQNNKEEIYGKSESSLQSLVPKPSDLKQTLKSLQSEVGQPSPKHQYESNRIETELLCMEVVESDSDNDTS